MTAVDEDLVLLNAIGELYRYGPAGEARLIARLPPGHYHRTNLATGPDGSVFVCGGFQIRRIFRISPTGEVSTVAGDLGDPGGIVLDRSGAMYVGDGASPHHPHHAGPRLTAGRALRLPPPWRR